MLTRTAKLGFILSAAFLAQASATAGEITLFSNEGFQGREITLRDATRSLEPLGFNDRGASMVVRSGRWEVCMHADFRDCQVVEPGQYARLDRMANQISSVREIGGGYDDRNDDRRDRRDGGGRGNGNGYGYGNGNGYGNGYGNGNGDDQSAPVIMFDSTEMRGRSLMLRGDVPNLTSFGFNDRAQSMVVQNGSWEFCVHQNFGGECRVYGPGEYRNLDRAFYRSITSARMVGDDDNRGRGNGRGRGGDRGRDGVELFSTGGFGGERVQVRDELRTLEQINFNDRAGSLIVYNGQWEFCQHADFRGQCLTYGPGRYDRLGSLNAQISSMRRVR